MTDAARRRTLSVLSPSESPVVAGVPAAVRNLSALRESGPIGSVSSPDDSRTRIALAGDGLAEPAELARFCDHARDAGEPIVWMWRGRPVGVSLPPGEAAPRWMPGGAIDASSLPPHAGRFEGPDSAWSPLASRSEIARVEDELFASSGRESDGYLSRLDRHVSTAISRVLVGTPVTPNQITIASIAVGLLGAWLLAAGAYEASLAGIGLIWFSAILDGCDGEVARVKLLTSESGRRLDLLGDHAVNLSTLAAVAVYVRRVSPSAAWLPAAVLLAVGVLTSSFVFWLVALRGERNDAAPPRFLERLASRDFVYLLIPLAALRRIDLFFYAAAVGSNLFWIVLLARQRSFRGSARRQARAIPG